MDTTVIVSAHLPINSFCTDVRQLGAVKSQLSTAERGVRLRQNNISVTLWSLMIPVGTSGHYTPAAITVEWMALKI